MNEQDMAKRITRHLNYGVNQMDRSMLERLQSVRKQALAVHTNPQQVYGMTIAGHGGLHSGHHGHFSLRFWLSLVVLLLGLLIIFNWQDNSSEPDDVDATCWRRPACSRFSRFSISIHG